MTNEELMLPRYKVIALWPDCDFHRGEILIQFQEKNNVDVSFAGETLNFHDHPTHWPHLFEELDWWEERKPEDIPMYLKSTIKYGHLKAGEVFKRCGSLLSPESFGYQKDIGGIQNGLYGIEEKFTLPATESEYNEYISKNKV